MNLEDNPVLEDAIFQFSQEPNCVDNEDCESLEIRCVSSIGLDRDNNCFFILKTDSWSIDSVDDLQRLIDRITKVMNK